jgi:hypothetical protein
MDSGPSTEFDKEASLALQENHRVNPADPELGLSKNRQITLRLLDDQEQIDCNFWCGVFRSGNLNMSQLTEERDVRRVFERAMKDGVAESGPLMISDSRFLPPRFLFLMPSPQLEFRERAIWLGKLTKTIRSWNTPCMGLSIPPEVLATDHSSIGGGNVAQELISQILTELIENSKIRDYYLLIGTMGLNGALNTAQRLRQELKGNDINLLVFH